MKTDCAGKIPSSSNAVTNKKVLEEEAKAHQKNLYSMCCACLELIDTFLSIKRDNTNVYLHYLSSKVPMCNSLFVQKHILLFNTGKVEGT